MSKVETTVDDPKKLAQRCKALEAQLRQTITKKEHHDIVLEFEDKLTAMEKTISGQGAKIAEQEKELGRARGELQKNASLGRQIADLGTQVAALAKTAEAQGKTAEAILFKVSQGTVPAAVHQQSISKSKELEEQIGGMVSRAEFASLQRRYEEAARQLSAMVPSSEYEALKGRVRELEAAISTTVPREQFDSSEATVRELRAKLAEHVPQSTYDDLVSKVVQLAEEVTGGQPPAEEEQTTLQPGEPAEPQEPSPEEPTPIMRPEIPGAPFPLKADARAETVSPAPSPVPVSAETEQPEVREVGTQLAELKSEVFDEARSTESSQANRSPVREPVGENAEETEPAPLAASASPESDGQGPQG